MLAPAVLLPGAAASGGLGVIGDSISVAADADDQCNDAFECLENLGADTDYTEVPLRIILEISLTICI